MPAETSLSPLCFLYPQHNVKALVACEHRVQGQVVQANSEPDGLHPHFVSRLTCS